jgi:hypothetical protein
MPPATSGRGGALHSLIGIGVWSVNPNKTWPVHGTPGILLEREDVLGFLTTLAFWLRSSVVSVLNSLTTIMKAPPSLLVI